jgi:tRNA-binding EMAP/Myf-like protein
MSISIRNNNLLNNIALITLNKRVKDYVVVQKGDLTIFKNESSIIALNIANSTKYISLKEGRCTIGLDDLKKIENLFSIDLSNSSNFYKVGKIIIKTIHPKSDKLFVLSVLIDREYQIVTNFNRIQENDFIVIDMLGAILPSGLEITPSKVVDVKSEGMICGYKTLMIKDNPDIIKPTTLEVGANFVF